MERMMKGMEEKWNEERKVGKKADEWKKRWQKDGRKHGNKDVKRVRMMNR